MIHYRIAAAAAALALALTACSSSSSSPKSSAPPNSPGSSAPAQPAAGGIIINNFKFSGTMTVTPGQKVTVTNKDSVAHTLTDKKSHKFDTGNIDSGGTGTFTAPTKPGSYPFGCTYHAQMAGTLVVK